MACIPGRGRGARILPGCPRLLVQVFSLLLLISHPSHAQTCLGGENLYCLPAGASGTGGWYVPGCDDGHCGVETWSVSGLPPGITATIDPVVTLTNRVDITVDVDTSTAPGLYPFEVSTSCTTATCTFAYAGVWVIPAGDQQNWKNLGPDCDHAGGADCGDPIDIASGNVFLQATDYATSGSNKLAFTRFYNSRTVATDFASALGPNWRSNYDRYLYIVTPGAVGIERANGQEFVFRLSDSGWATDSDLDYSLTQAGTGVGSSWTLSDPNDTVETYYTISQHEAVLTAIQYRNGYTLTIARDPASARVVSVTDSYGRVLSFAYSDDGLLSGMTTPDGPTVSYSYNAGGLLSTVSFPTSPVGAITYVYGESSAPATALTSMLDEAGQVFSQWTYDSMGRGLTNALGGPAVSAKQMTVTYHDTDGTRTVTNVAGVADTYTFQMLQGAPKVVQIRRGASSTTAAATRTFSYDSNGYLASATDWNGNLTTYINNSHGLPVAIHEAVGSRWRGRRRLPTIRPSCI